MVNDSRYERLAKDENKQQQATVICPQGYFFEDFELGQVMHHGVPRTITEGDCSLYIALTGSRFALHCAETVAQSCGFAHTPVDNLLLFHIAFGKTVNDISLNAVANLGYAEVVFKHPVYIGDTISVTSEVIGLKENSSGKTGIVYVHSIATNQRQQAVLSFKRWVMVHKRTELKSDVAIVPKTAPEVSIAEQQIPDNLNVTCWAEHLSDCQITAEQLSPGMQVFHRDGITINDSDHSLATRLYQNNARVHFDQHWMKANNTERLVYGGHIISLCRALSYNGLANAIWLSAIHGGKHVNPCYASDTIYCLSTIVEITDLDYRDDVAIVRINSLGIKNNTPEQMPYIVERGELGQRYHQDVVLDLDYSVIMRKGKTPV
ncbi:MaoC family dehydratase [Thalassotalea ponticola]|uniref:MaoC family dehydratase n=1 Tax=Thalassotalea ponticola TaxID=1523392 RepID=UPI0025B3F0AD|nr:MaoC family dehydratase [Thalassotalea ponticola]MDN3651236.1 MaoC family dehydratase [Thalassotalea ponticola]